MISPLYCTGHTSSPCVYDSTPTPNLLLLCVCALPNSQQPADCFHDTQPANQLPVCACPVCHCSAIFCHLRPSCRLHITHTYHTHLTSHTTDMFTHHTRHTHAGDRGHQRAIWHEGGWLVPQPPLLPCPAQCDRHCQPAAGDCGGGWLAEFVFWGVNGEGEARGRGGEGRGVTSHGLSCVCGCVFGGRGRGQIAPAAAHQHQPHEMGGRGFQT